MESYTVRPGESLSAIAHRFGTSWQKIAQANALAHPDRLVPGQRLMIPPRVGAPVSAPVHPASAPPQHPAAAPHAAQRQSAAPQPAPAPAPAAPAAGTVAAGDVTEAQLKAIMPHAGSKAATFLAPLNTAMRTHHIESAQQRAAFLAQISVESSDLRHTEENLNYSAERLHQVWPKRFKTVEAAKPYAHNAEALGNHVYANRLGNGDEASGDGYRFRGRGLMQTTGRDNYRQAGFEDNPEALANPTTAADSAGRFWESHSLNARTTTELAHAQFNGITYTVNGGYNGAAERWTAYQLALKTLNAAAATTPAGTPK